MVSGLAITLSPEPSLHDGALRALARAPGMTLGPCAGARLAATLETGTVAEAEARWDDILAVPGVVHLDLVCCLEDDILEGDAP